MTSHQTVELKETKNGFSERDMHSKAILNKDSDLLLRYKIQKTRHMNLVNSASEIEKMRSEFQSLRNEFNEIRQLLLQIATGNK